ncbi:hypothetical protein Bbelb_256360 [Branchiostoma belcheri]|nr:hypothetical protein Bbelb_256360 [Branchiostoma belcheri]
MSLRFSADALRDNSAWVSWVVQEPVFPPSSVKAPRSKTSPTDDAPGRKHRRHLEHKEDTDDTTECTTTPLPTATEKRRAPRIHVLFKPHKMLRSQSYRRPSKKTAEGETTLQRT